MKPLAKETLLTLMQYVDGELADDELERAEKVVQEDPDAAQFVAELRGLEKVVEHLVGSRLVNPAAFDVSDEIMARLDSVEQDAREAPAKLAPVIELGARARWKRVGVVAVATLALAAGVAIVMGQQQPDPTAKTKTPRGPVTGEVAIEAPKGGAPANGTAAQPEEKRAGVDVNLVHAPSHAVSVFVLPETNANASSVVIWIDDSVGGQK